MKLLLIVLCIFSFHCLHAQLFSMDSIKTEDDVIGLIYKANKKYNLDWIYKIQNDADHKRHLDTLNATWLIEDFNNDGRNDFVFNGFLNREHGLFALLSNGLNDYLYFNLSRYSYKYSTIESYKKFPVTIQLLLKNSVNLLIISGYTSLFINKEWIIEKQVDTLKGFTGGFIEWKSGKKKPVQLYSLEIEVEQTGLNANMLSPNKHILMVSDQKKVVYKRIISAYNRSEGNDDLNVEYISAIDNDMKQALDELLSEMDLPNMKDSFEIGATHQNVAYIRIRTSGGTKKIYDYGLEGSYGLRLLYTKLFAIIKVLKANAAKYLTGYDYLILD